MCPPHSPTRITKNSILKLAGAFHCPNTSRIRFWAFSYSMGEPCGRSNQLITYFIFSSFFEYSYRNGDSVFEPGDEWGASEPFVEKHSANLSPIRRVKWIQCTLSR